MNLLTQWINAIRHRIAKRHQLTHNMDITVTELKEKMSNGDDFVLIDVREPYENADFNVGGLLIPMGNFPAVLPQLEEHQDKEIILYCRSGRRSGVIQQMMLRAGFGNVRNLEGGMLAWIDEFGR